MICGLALDDFRLICMPNRFGARAHSDEAAITNVVGISQKTPGMSSVAADGGPGFRSAQIAAESSRTLEPSVFGFSRNRRR